MPSPDTASGSRPAVTNDATHLRIGVIGVQNGWSSGLLADAVAARTGSRCLVDLGAACLDLASGEFTANGVRLNDFHALIIKKIAPAYAPDNLDRLELLHALQRSGVRIFSRPDRLARLIDRVSCTLELHAAGIPLQPTVITEDVSAAVAAVRRMGRAVFKPLFTSKARGMTVLSGDDPQLIERLQTFRADGNPVMYLQQLIPDLQRDLGVAFLGGEYLATYARVKASDNNAWTTSTSGGGKYAAFEPCDEVIALAKKAQDIFGLDFTCVDVAETADGLRVFEVSAFGGFRGLREANGIDAASLYVDHVIRSLSGDRDQ